MYIKAITTDKEFDSVKSEWMDFEKKVNNKNITSSYLWQRTWWKHFGHIDNAEYGYNKKLSIFFLYKDKNELRAIIPFCIVKRKLKKIFHYTIVEFIAQQWGATYLDIICGKLSTEEYDFIFDWLKQNKKYDLIELNYIPENTPNFNLSRENATVMSACPEIKISNYNDMDHYIQEEYSSKLRQNLRRPKEKMKREGISYCEETLEGIDIDNFKEIENISRSKTTDNKHCIYDDLQKRAFLKNIYATPEFRGHILKVILNGKLSSYGINFIYNNWKYWFDASYDRTYPHYNLGAISADLNIKDSFEKKIETHCMGPGIDPYKLKFSKQLIKIYSFLKKGNTLKSGLIYKKKLSANKYIENNFLRELNEQIPQERLS